MNNKYRKAVILLCGAALFCGAQPQAEKNAPQQQQPARFIPPPLDPNLFTLTVQMDRTGFRVGEPIPIKITLQNVSNRDLMVVADYSLNEYTVQVFLENGQLAPMTPRGAQLTPNKRRRNWGGPRYEMVKPLGILQNKIDITQIYDLRQPGAYTVVVSRQTDEMAEVPQMVAWFKATSAPVKFFISQ